ncbi:DNA methyltransferase [Rhizobium sp. 007]|uniref:class I SAM-dependent DNA methyltransferase n=1 Tax=Rhizobium sp. 007 TaxID=2785056 RepID=UPI00188F1CF5|nr:DNA methyltransferase [Rhizobium sp. 007]QPB20205.1 class I SAM-dependent DNA methyltransferase [Rhizobium sp. 007]
MRLSWNEIRVRASGFARDWKDANYEKGETHSFYNDFFKVFGIKRRRVANFEQHVQKLDKKSGYIDLLWPGVLLIEQKSAGKNLTKAKSQAHEYFSGLKESEYPRYILLSDFQSFELYDLDEGGEWKFKLEEFPKKVELFDFIAGGKKKSYQDQPEANIAASRLMGAVHDALEATGYRGHDLEKFLVRLLFCLFADATGIFETGIFRAWLHENTNEDGTGLGGQINELFQVLNTKEEERHSNLDEQLAQFPYINGELFKETLKIPSFDSKIRQTLLDASAFKWEKVSPAIFGSLFQSVMLSGERRRLGAHYTSEKNILKLIGPLFLDDLRRDLKRIKELKRNRAAELQKFWSRLGKLKFFDPACGCGNFLIIAYRELRLIEIEVLQALYPEGQLELDVTVLSKIDVDQFYGIELEEFPARIAAVAMWMMDHIMNNQLSYEFGKTFTRIPLNKSPRILNADALETDWHNLISPLECSYVLGNPPFIGSKNQSSHQRKQVRDLAKLGGSGGTLDYVSAWFIKAGEYVQNGSADIAFVSTNSITQGEQVAQLWPILFKRFKLEISFAHRTFAWTSEASGAARVHVVIIGLAKSTNEPPVKRLFSYPSVMGDPTESNHKALTAYLFDASDLNDRHRVVSETSRPLNGLPKQIIGTKPIDGGYLICDTEEERQELLAACPEAAHYLHPYIGGEEFLYGNHRWLLTLDQSAPSDDEKAMPIKKAKTIKKRLDLVRSYRKGEIRHKRRQNGELKPPGQSATMLADSPSAFHVTVIPTEPFLAFPEVSSEKREYVPLGWITPPSVPSNKLKIVQQPSLFMFGVLSSQMHKSWLANIGGRLESRFQYSSGIVYNTFPWPHAAPKAKENVEKLANEVINARSKYPNSSLAQLYDPDAMPKSLRQAHKKLDIAVDRLYRSEPFNSERERAEHLFELYEKMVLPMLTTVDVSKVRRRLKSAA